MLADNHQWAVDGGGVTSVGWVMIQVVEVLTPCVKYKVDDDDEVVVVVVVATLLVQSQLWG